ncbi:MAG: hypothetical protein ACRD07_00420 [Acidimicrobiales bacterium]
MTTETASPQRWFFVHLHKTAGTALLQRLRVAVGEEAIYPTASDQRTYLASLKVDLLHERFAEHGDRIRVVTGHFPLCTTELLGVPFVTMTVLRDPVERTLSALRNLRERDPEWQGKPLEEIYADPVRFRCLIQNHMVKMLAITCEEMTDGFLTVLDFDGTHLERAKRNLAERIDVWGLQEHFDDFCDELVRRFGWDLGGPRFANRSAPYEAEDGLRERIAEDNRLDVELYQFALELHEQRSAAPSI